MNVLSLVRRLLDALLTSLAVVLGLTPDPTVIPVRQDIRRLH